MVFNHGLVFLCAIVITGDGAGANIHMGTNHGVANVGEMVGLGVRTDLTVLYFGEVSNVAVFG